MYVWCICDVCLICEVCDTYVAHMCSIGVMYVCFHVAYVWSGQCMCGVYVVYMECGVRGVHVVYLWCGGVVYVLCV